MRGIRLLMMFSALAGASALGSLLLAQQASWEESFTLKYKSGTVLKVLSQGIVGSTNCQVRPTSVFKDGSLHAPGFVQNAVVTAAKCLTHPIVPGSQLYLAVMSVNTRTSKIEFVMLQCDVADCSSGMETSAKTQVTFEYPKGFLGMASLAKVESAVSQVFSIDTVAGSAASGAAVAAAGSALAAPSEAGANVAGLWNKQLSTGPPAPSGTGILYINSRDNADRIQLNPDRTFSLQEGGQSYSGTYTIGGVKLMLHIVELNKDVEIAYRGNSVVVNEEEIWMLAPGQTPRGVAPSVPQSNVQPNDVAGMMARADAEVPSKERVGQAVRVFLDDLKTKGALPKEAFAMVSAVMASKYDTGPDGMVRGTLEATGFFQLTHGNYECGSADSSGAKSKKTNLYMLKVGLRRQPGQPSQWILTEVAGTGTPSRACSPVWSLQIPVP